jgi:hypothetical protein
MLSKRDKKRSNLETLEPEGIDSFQLEFFRYDATKEYSSYVLRILQPRSKRQPET